MAITTEIIGATKVNALCCRSMDRMLSLLNEYKYNPTNEGKIVIE
jgi:hypothetical protein